MLERITTCLMMVWSRGYERKVGEKKWRIKQNIYFYARGAGVVVVVFLCFYDSFFQTEKTRFLICFHIICRTSSVRYSLLNIIFRKKCHQVAVVFFFLLQMYLQVPFLPWIEIVLTPIKQATLLEMECSNLNLISEFVRFWYQKLWNVDRWLSRLVDHNDKPQITWPKRKKTKHIFTASFFPLGGK